MKEKQRKIAFIGAGSLGFTKKIITDILSYPALSDSILALMDTDESRLTYSYQVSKRIIREGKFTAKVEATKDRKEAISNADYVFITILAHGLKGFTPEIEIPKKYGVNQAVGDTTGPGGVFRAQRTIPMMLDIVRDVERYASPGALVLNYTNPMHMVSWAIYKNSPVKYVGLCHSIQGTTEILARTLDIPIADVDYWVAGINHQAWVLEFKYRGKSLLENIRKKASDPEFYQEDPVRCEMCRHLGYFVTESSPHNSEYNPWFRKNDEVLAKFLPGGIDNYGILLGEYGKKRDSWKSWMKGLASGRDPLDLTRSHEYGSGIINAIETNQPFYFNGNLKNTGLLTNLPEGCCVEVPCVADGKGIRPLFVGRLPTHLAALNRMNVSVHELSVLAAETKDPELIFQALAYDPLTAAVLSLQQIRHMTAEILKVQRHHLPGYDVDRFDKKSEMKSFGGKTLLTTRGKKKDAVLREFHFLDRYYILGPFENGGPDGTNFGLKKHFPPEDEIDLQAAYAGKGGRNIIWKKITADDMNDDGYVDLTTTCGMVDLAVAYAYIVIEAISDTRAVLKLGSDDGIAVWLNKKQIYLKETVRGATPGQTAVTLPLKHGKNELLLKIDQKFGGWGFYANFAERYPGISLRWK